MHRIPGAPPTAPRSGAAQRRHEPAVQRLTAALLFAVSLAACGAKPAPPTPAAVASPAREQPAGPPTPASAIVPETSPDSLAAGDGASAGAGAGAQNRTLRRAPACSYLAVAEVAGILRGPIGKPAEKESADASSCSYPPLDMTSYQQAQIDIAWQGAGTTTLEDTMAGTFGDSAEGRQVAHKVQLGDTSSYSREGILRMHAGNALISITLLMRPDSEDKATAIGKLLLERMGYATPQEDAATPFPSQEIPLVKGVTLADACPEAAAPLKAAFAQAAQDEKSARVPLKKGLTWAYTWTEGDAEPRDHECLEQVSDVTQNHIDMSVDCEMRDGTHQHNRRRICRQDLLESHTFHPETWEGAPLVIAPTTLSSLSAKALHELKTTGSAPHRWLEMTPHPTHVDPLHLDVETTLVVDPAAAKFYAIQINDQLVQLPVVSSASKKDSDDDDDGASPFVKRLQASVLADFPAGEDPHGTGINAMRATTLDDERFPLILDYEVPERNYRIKLTKITYGAEPEMEKQLAAQEPVTIYGIYFDFASDKMRPESTPVLDEIAAILTKNPGWKLSVTGHTDAIGSSAGNLDLSKRRAAAVKAALIEHYRIEASRLTTGGAGAGVPQDTNDTAEGRARNRRVVLRRES